MYIYGTYAGGRPGVAWTRWGSAAPRGAEFRSGRRGCFGELEDELTALSPGGYGGGRSPDRADAMVWALTELVMNMPLEQRVRWL